MHCHKEKSKPIKKCPIHQPRMRLHQMKPIILSGHIPNKPDQDILRSEDGGSAIIATISGDTNIDTGIYVRIVSWDEEKNHIDMKRLLGKKVKVTISIEKE